MVLPKRRKKSKKKEQSGPCRLVFSVQFIVLATVLLIVTFQPPKNITPKRRTLRSHPVSERSQPSYELPMSPSHALKDTGGDTQTAAASKPSGLLESSSLPFPWPVPGNMSIEQVLPKLLTLFRENDNRENGRLVNLGAGVRDQDPTFPLLDTDEWEALLADGAEYQGALMAKRFPSDKIKTAVAYITAASIGGVLSDNDFDHDLDLLKIDIDSFDCKVVESLLQTVRPSVIVMEVNVKYPANIRFAFLPGMKDNSGEQYPFDSEKREHIYGCSLAYQVNDLMRPNDYEILYLESNNAIYYDKRKDVPSLRDKTPLSMTELYNRGYWNMPNRRTSFSFNNELEFWQDYKADQILSYLKTKQKASHANHHVVIGDLVEDGMGEQPPLLHGIFHPVSGELK